MAGGGGFQGVGKFLQGGDAGGSIVWVGKVGPLSVNGKEDRGYTHVVPDNDHGNEIGAIRRWDMGDARVGSRTRGSGNPVG